MYTVLLDMNTDQGERMGLARLAHRMAQDLAPDDEMNSADTGAWEER